MGIIFRLASTNLHFDIFNITCTIPYTLQVNSTNVMKEIINLYKKFKLCEFIADYKKTSLKPTIEVFETFLKKLENTWKGKLIEQSGTAVVNRGGGGGVQGGQLPPWDSQIIFNFGVFFAKNSHKYVYKKSTCKLLCLCWKICKKIGSIK